MNIAGSLHEVLENKLYFIGLSSGIWRTFRIAFRTNFPRDTKGFLKFLVFLVFLSII
jgi:hypothetical protein